MIKSRNTDKTTRARYEDDPSELKIDHNTGAPRVPVAKKRKIKTVEVPEVEESLLAPSTSKGKIKTKKVHGNTGKKKPRTIAGAKRRAARLKAQIPTEEELLAELPAVATSQEQEHLDEYLHMFRKLRRLIRKAERDCLETNNPRLYYAVCTLYSAQREVIADIRSVTDMSSQVSHIEEHVLQPMVRNIGQNLLDSFYQARKLLIETTKPAETQFALSKYEELTKEQGKYLQTVYAEALEKVSKYMIASST